MDRSDEMQQTLSQMNATTEQLERLAKEKEDANNAKAQTQAKLEVREGGRAVEEQSRACMLHTPSRLSRYACKRATRHMSGGQARAEV